MSSVTTPAPLVAKTIVQQLAERTFACSKDGCGQRELTADRVRVPDLTNLYLGARYSAVRGEMSGVVDERYPLTAAEIAQQARCLNHFLTVDMFPVFYIGDLVDKMLAGNAKHLYAEQTEVGRAAYLARRQAPKPQGQRGGFVNALLATRKPTTEEKPRPKYRHRNDGPRETTPAGPKRFGDEHKSSEPSEPTKAGKKGKQKAAKKKQKQGRQ